MPSQPRRRRSARLAGKARATSDAEPGKPAKKPARRSVARSPKKTRHSSECTPRRSNRVKAQRNGTASCKAPRKSTSGYEKEPPVPIIRTPATATKSKEVRFNLGRNIFAKYDKKSPPNAVDRMAGEDAAELFPDDNVKIDDDETRRNQEILAEWDGNFDEALISDDSESDERFVTFRRLRRKTMSARRVSMSP